MSKHSDVPIVLPASVPEKQPADRPSQPRAQERFPFTAAAEVYELRSQTRVKGRCSDLSSGGCYIDVISPFPAGALVRVRIERENIEFEAAAVVAYAHECMGMGLAFTEMKSEHREVLRFWIGELNGEQPCPPEVFTPEQEARGIDSDANMRLVTNELIYLLVRKKIITENEGAELLRGMFR
jgi:hypothetical protein